VQPGPKRGYQRVRIGSAVVTLRSPTISIVGAVTSHGQRKFATRGKKRNRSFTVNTQGEAGEFCSITLQPQTWNTCLPGEIEKHKAHG